MALDPRLIAEAGNIPSLDVGGILQLRDLMGARRATAAEAARKREADTRLLSLRSLAGAKFASGDGAGAVATAAGGGDIEGAKSFQDLDAAQLERAYAISQRTAPILLSLKNVPAEQRPAALEKAAPILLQNGFTADHLPQLDLSDAGLDAVGASAITVAQQYEKVAKDRDAALAREKFDYERTHDATTDQTTREGNYLSAGLMPPGSDAAPMAGGAPGSGGSGALSTRLNNPGAIRFDPKNQWQGQVANSGGFVQFDTPENGARAHAKLIGNQIAAGFDTPLKWAAHYAPSSDGNDPVAYAQRVASALGISINDPIPASAIPKMAAASAAVEAGGTPAPGARAPSAARIIPGGKLDKSAAAEGTPELTPQAIETLAQQVAAGGDIPSLGLGKSGAALKAKILNRAAEVQAANGNDGAAMVMVKAARKANATALTDLTKRNGVMSQSKNTAVANGNLLVSAAATGAGTTGSPVLNRWQQAYRSGVKGSPEVAAFGLAINTFANEYAKVVSGATGAAGVAEGARQEMLKHLSEASTPEQVATIVKQAKLEMASSTESMAGQIAETRRQLSTGGQSTLTAPPKPAAKAPPTVGKVEAGYRFKGGDPASRSSWEKMK